MVVHLYEPMEYEQATIRDLERRHAQWGALQGMATKELSDRVAHIANLHGSYMQPGTITALAVSGMDEDPDIMAQVTSAEADRSLEQDGFWRNLGNWVQGKGGLWSKRQEQVGGVVKAPFDTQPDTTAGKVVSAPFRAATSPFRTDYAKSIGRNIFTGMDMVWEEGVSRPLRWAMQNEIEQGGDAKSFWANTNPFTGQQPFGIDTPNSVAESLRDQGQYQAWEDAGRPRPSYSDTGRSPGLVALQDGRDLGEGFFPMGEAGALSAAEREGQEGLGRFGEVFDEADPQFQRELESAANDAYMYRGKPLSMGRFMAVEVFEPDTKPYNLLSGLVDASLIIGLDPTSIGLTKLSHTRNIKKNFGVVDGHRHGVDVDKAVGDFLTGSSSGRNLTKWIADTDDLETVYLALGKNPSVAVARELTDAKTSSEVFDILSRELGFSIPQRPKDPTSLLPTVKRSIRNNRLFNDMPSGMLDLNDMDAAFPTLRNYLMNADLDATVRKARLDEFSRLDLERRPQVQAFMRNVYKDIDNQINAAHGKDLNLAQRFGKQWDDFEEVARAYFVDEIGQPGWFPGVKTQALANGETVPLPTAHGLSEMMERSIPLMDIREVRRQASKLNDILNLPGVDSSILLADGFMSSIWKPMQLFRGAWAVRVVGLDEQMRMAAVGMDSLYRNPLSWLGYIVGRKEGSRLSRFAKGDVKVVDPDDALRMGDEKAVERWLLADSDEFFATMQNRDAGWRGMDPSQGIWTGDYDVIPRTHRRFADAWTGEVQQMARDELGKRVAGGLREGDGALRSGGGMDQVKSWWWDGDGRQFRHDLAGLRATGEKGKYLSPEDAEKYGFTEFADAMMHSRQFADDFVDSWLDRVLIKSGGDSEIIDLIATGRLGDRNVVSDWSSKHVKRFLKQRMDAAPDYAKGPRMVEDGVLSGSSSFSRAVQGWEKGVETIFHALGAVPTNKLSRSPAFLQSYWSRMEAQAVFMSPSTRKEAAKLAREANMKDTARRIEDLGGAKQSSRTLLHSFDDADTVAKHYAMREVKDLLYSLDKRSQFMDIYRHFFPFGEAFKEIFTTWAKIGMENPQIVRRAQIGIDGARGSGFFYTDPDTGEEMFGYPGGGLLGKTLGLGEGQSMELSGRVSGLNLMDLSSSVIPGLGPIASWSAARFVPPDWEGVNQQLFPFGRPGTSPAEVIKHFGMPAYAQRFFQGLSEGEIDERGWNNTVADISKALIASGEYTLEESDQALAAAESKARHLFIIRGLAQSILPTSPSIQFSKEDKDGRWWTTQVLATDLREMLDEHDGDSDAAMSEFINKYGIDPIHLSQPRTKSLRHRHLTNPGIAWERENADLMDELPLTMGLWAPEGEEGELDWEKYLHEIDLGNRAQLSAREQLHAANNVRGWMIYGKVRDEVLELQGDTDHTRAWLRAYKQHLKAQYPGFDSLHETVAEGARVSDMMIELENAYRNPDPRLRDTESWAAFEGYMQVRDILQGRLAEAGYSLNAEVNAANERQALKELGDYLASEHPAFQPLWRSALSREVKE